MTTFKYNNACCTSRKTRSHVQKLEIATDQLERTTDAHHLVMLLALPEVSTRSNAATVPHAYHEQRLHLHILHATCYMLTCCSCFAIVRGIIACGTVTIMHTLLPLQKTGRSCATCAGRTQRGVWSKGSRIHLDSTLHPAPTLPFYTRTQASHMLTSYNVPGLAPKHFATSTHDT